jgi:hypothetical protein
MALVETHWPGASAERVEELVTKNIEKVLASNTKISKIESHLAQQRVDHHLRGLGRHQGREPGAGRYRRRWRRSRICPTARVPSVTSATSAIRRR